MGMKHLFFRIFISICTTAFLAGCGSSHAEKINVFIAAEWNLQALFDGEENGKEYDEYRKSSLWTSEKYTARLTAISRAIQMMRQGSTPDLMGFVEVENSGVLEDLSAVLSKNGRFWTAFASLPGSPLGIGFISRFPIIEARSHSITVGDDTAPRPVLELRVEPDGKPMVFLLCHWKSKLGGEKVTEALRRASAMVVQRRLRELRESEAGTPVIIMGDLNENYDEFFRQSYLCALLPDDPDAASLAHNATGFLVLSKEKPPRSFCFPNDVPALYSPWYEELSEGSYFYKEEWETIDHLLLSESLFDGSGWEFSGCRVLNQAPFSTSDGKPDRYVPRLGRGLSDHLPLLLELRLASAY